MCASLTTLARFLTRPCHAFVGRVTERKLLENQNRVAAATGYRIAQIDKAAGVAHFKSTSVGSYAKNRNTKRQMDHWGKHLEANGNVHDARRTGRPPKVSDASVVECALELVQGYTIGVGAERVWRGFTSLDGAVQSGHAPVITEVLSESGMSTKGLYRRILAVMPELPGHKSKVDVKHHLTDKVKASRMKVAGQLRRWPLKKLRTVVWMDAKKMHICPKALKVYTLDPEAVLEDVRLPQGSFSSGFVLHYYADVNALTGLVKLVWVTGTTGVNHGSTTMVRPAI
jgi:hypothetical protein